MPDKKQNGGARPGAGRKPKSREGATIVVALRVPPSVAVVVNNDRVGAQDCLRRWAKRKSSS